MAAIDLIALARDVLARDLTDPLWPCLTESDWDRDAKLLAAAVLDLDRFLRDQSAALGEVAGQR